MVAGVVWAGLVVPTDGTALGLGAGLVAPDVGCTELFTPGLALWLGVADVARRGRCGRLHRALVAGAAAGDVAQGGAGGLVAPQAGADRLAGPELDQRDHEHRDQEHRRPPSPR